MAEGQIICCCGAATWSRVIAWLQIVLNSISALLVILALAGVASVDVEDKDGDSIKGSVLAVLIIALLFAFIGIAFGVLLLMGTNRRRPAYLKAWIVFTAILLVWAIISAILGSAGVAIRVVQCILEILIYGFGIWVVYTLKKEIETDGASPGVPQYYQ